MADTLPGDDTVEQLARLHEEHRQSATPLQHLANRLTDLLARPLSLTVIATLIFAWIAGNYVARLFGSRALEEFPFPDLAFVATVAAFLIAVLILTAQRHQEQLAERRAQLTLQIALLSERKIAKVIALLEEQRRDNPQLESRHDPEAAAMAASADPRAELAKLEGSVPPRT